MSHQYDSSSSGTNAQQLLQNNDTISDDLAAAAAALPEGCGTLLAREDITGNGIRTNIDPESAFDGGTLLMDVNWDANDNSSVKWTGLTNRFHVRFRFKAPSPQRVCALQYVTDGAQQRGPSLVTVEWNYENVNIADDISRVSAGFEGSFTEDVSSAYTPPHMNTVPINATAPVYRMRFWTETIANGGNEVIFKEFLLWAANPTEAPTTESTPAPVPVPTPDSTPAPFPAPTPEPTLAPSPTPTLDEDEDFRIFYDRMNWSDARAFCQNMSNDMYNWDLASIGSEEENAQLAGVFNESLVQNPESMQDNVVWIGLRFYKSTESDTAADVAEWVDGLPFGTGDYNAWADGQPQRAARSDDGSRDINRDCAVLRPRQFAWAVLYCNETRNFACRARSTLTPTPTSGPTLTPTVLSTGENTGVRTTSLLVTPTSLPTPTVFISGDGNVLSPSDTPALEAWMLAVIVGVSTVGFCCTLFVLWKIYTLHVKKQKLKALAEEQPGARKQALSIEEGVIQMGVLGAEADANSVTPANPPPAVSSDGNSATSSDDLSGGPRGKLYYTDMPELVNPESSRSAEPHQRVVRSESARSGIGGDASAESSSAPALSPMAESVSVVPRVSTPTPKPESRRGSLEGIKPATQEKSSMQSRNKAPAPIDVFPPAPERVVFDSGAVSDDVDEQSVSPSLSRSRTTSADLGFHGERDDALYGVLSSDSENSNWARDFQMSSESDADDAPRKSSSGNTSSHVGNDDEDDSDEDDDASIDVEPRQNAGDDRLPPMHTVVVNPFDTVMPPGMDVGGGVMSSMPTLRNGVATIGAITTFTPTMTTLNTAPTAAGSSAPGSSPSRKPDRRRENDRRCTTCNITFETPVMLVAHLKEKHNIDRGYTCDVCQKLFARKYNMEVHRRTHMKASARPHVCPKCKETFAQRSNLKRHMLVRHEKPGKCPRCKMRFASEDEFEVHWAATHPHDKKMPLRVPQAHLRCVCGQQLPTLASLHQHELRCTGHPGGGANPMVNDPNATTTMPHSCSLCGERFLQRSNLKRHMLVRHEKPCKCPGCKERFATQEEYEVHWKKAHPGETMKKLKLRVRQAHLRCNCNTLFDTLKELQDHKKTCKAPNPTSSTPRASAALVSHPGVHIVPKREVMPPNATLSNPHAIAMSDAEAEVRMNQMRIWAGINAANASHPAGSPHPANIHPNLQSLSNLPPHLLAQAHLKAELPSHPSSTSSSMSREASPPCNFDAQLQQMSARQVYTGTISDHDVQRPFVPRSNLPIGQILTSASAASADSSAVASRSRSHESTVDPTSVVPSGMVPQAFAAAAGAPGRVTLPMKQEPQTHPSYAQGLSPHSQFMLSPQNAQSSASATQATTQGVGQSQLSPSVATEQALLAFIQARGIDDRALLASFFQKQKSQANLAAVLSSGASSREMSQNSSPRIPPPGLDSTVPASSMQNLSAGLASMPPVISQENVSIPSLKTEPALGSSSSMNLGPGTAAMSAPMTDQSLSASTLQMLLQQSSAVKQNNSNALSALQRSTPQGFSHLPQSPHDSIIFPPSSSPFSQSSATPNSAMSTSTDKFTPPPGQGASVLPGYNDIRRIQTDMPLTSASLGFSQPSAAMPTAATPLTYMPTTNDSFASPAAAPMSTGPSEFSVPRSQPGTSRAPAQPQQQQDPAPLDRFPSTTSSNAALASGPLELGGESGLTSAQFENRLRRENSLSLSRVSSQQGGGGGSGGGGHVRMSSTGSLEGMLASDESLMQLLDFSNSS